LKFRKLKHFNVNHRFIERALKSYNEIGQVEDKNKTGRKRIVRTKKVREHFKQTNDRWVGKMAKSSMCRVLRFKSLIKIIWNWSHTKNQNFTAYLRLKNLKEFKNADTSLLEIIFSNEELLLLQGTDKQKNDRIYSIWFRNIWRENFGVERYQSVPRIMVRGSISKKDKLPLLFIEDYYIKHILQDHLL
jgi:hypothetical protein